MTMTDIDNLINFNDVTFCEEIEAFCTTLSAAIVGGLGLKDEVQHKASRSMIYGSIFKTR